MDVFISWSGEKSRKAAEAIRGWLPNVIQAVNPYFTPTDIDKGQRWSQEIAGKLNQSQFGIILLTKENLNAPWILFEAGALSKNIELSHICPVLLDLKPIDLTGPLVQFQASQFEKNEIRKLLESINNSLEDLSLSEKTLDSVFNKWWPDLEIEINNILSEDTDELMDQVRSERDLIEEILRLVREGTYSSFEPSNKPYEKVSYKPVSYDERTRTIKVWLNENRPYEIGLDRIDSGSELMDFVLQINGKGICKADHIKAFLDCIEELTDRYFSNNAQGIFCPGGNNIINVKWPENQS